MSSIIRTDELRFSYTTAEGVAPVVLDGVSLEIEEGSFVAVLGHNGSGKSTLAKHMNAILLPSGGAVYVDGIDTRDEARLLDIRRTVGMVFQNPDNQIVANVVEASFHQSVPDRPPFFPRKVRICSRFSDKPLSEKSPLWKFDNVAISPHNSCLLYTSSLRRLSL